jgi:hypothetical protein
MLVPQGVPQKSKLRLEALRRLADHSRNYHEYRSKLRNTAPPAVPFLGEFTFLFACPTSATEACVLIALRIQDFILRT